MSAPCPGPVRVLAIDPSTRGFGFAVLEGPDRLVDWGVAELSSKADKEFLVRLEHLVDRYRPDLLVVEEIVGSRRGARARGRINRILGYARGRRLAVVQVSRTQVREVFQGTGTTKYEIAVAIARIFPELASRLPGKRRPWESEDERMNVFDAVGFALVRPCGVQKVESPPAQDDPRPPPRACVS